jgi:hypothetical protein
VLSDSRATEVLHLSDNLSSDLLEFSEYNFSYNPEKNKYKKFLKASYFDSYTSKKAGIEYDSLKAIGDFCFPQLSGEEVEEDGVSGYFGMITVSNQSVILLDVPGESWTLTETTGEETETPGVWKIEMYKEEIDSNCVSQGGFIEQTTKELLGVHTDSDPEPILTITLGPTPELSNNPESYYYTERTQSTTTLGTADYITLQQEVSGKKIIYLVVSSTGDLKDINLSYSAWSQSPQPNRNQSTWSLRNDYYQASRNYVEPGVVNDFLVDTNSGTLLGTKKLDLVSDCPIMSSKLSRAFGVWSPEISYDAGEEIYASGKTWTSRVSGNLGEVPEYSPYWLTEVEDLQNDYISLDAYSNSRAYGDIEPSGNISLRENSGITFKLTPEVGYDFPVLDLKKQAGSLGTTPYITLAGVKFSTENIGFPDPDDIYKIRLSGIAVPGDLVFSFSEIQSELVIFMTIDKDWYAAAGSSMVYSYPDYAQGVGVKVYIGDTETEISRNGSWVARIGDTLKIVPDTSESGYTVLGYSWTDVSGVSHTVEGQELTIDSVDYSNQIIYMQLESKKYLCKVSEYTGFEISKTGGYVEFGQSWSFQFYPSSSSTRFIGFKVYSGKTGKEISDLSGFQVSSNSGTGISEFTISKVIDDYNIELLYENK